MEAAKEEDLPPIKHIGVKDLLEKPSTSNKIVMPTEGVGKSNQKENSNRLRNIASRRREERGTLWKQVISRKYGVEEGGWCTREVREEGYDVGFWKEIRKEWPLIKSNLVFSMGDGRRVRFWENKWCGDDTLSLSFPLLFALAAFKEEWVAKVWDASREEGAGIHIFLGHLMIGSWRRWRDSLSPHKERRCTLIWRIRFSGKRLRMVCFLL